MILVPNYPCIFNYLEIFVYCSCNKIFLVDKQTSLTQISYKRTNNNTASTTSRQTNRHTSIGVRRWLQVNRQILRVREEYYVWSYK